MMAFMRRLVGRESEQLSEQERFKRNLNGMAAKNDQLDELRSQLDEIVLAVEQKAHAQNHSLTATIDERSSGLLGVSASERPEEI